MDLRAVASRFPLAPRPRPAGTRLADRIAGLLDTAHAAADSTGPQALTAAARVHNQAALIASDAGLPDMARRLCWQHTELYLPTLPLTAATARHALEPVVNLARLTIRDGNGWDAWQLLESLHHALATAVPVEVDGRRLPGDELIATTEDRNEVLRWLWTVRLADGLRALTTAGAWNHAAEHARRERGIGQRLFDGRQTAILAELLAGNNGSARNLLEHSSVGEPWEAAVQSCLALMCRHATGSLTDHEQQRALHHWQQLPKQPGLILFRTRIGLTVWELANAAGDPVDTTIGAVLPEQVIATADGYAARELLHTCWNTLTPSHRTALESVRHAAGLDTGNIPPELQRQLDTALEISTRWLAETLEA